MKVFETILKLHIDHLHVNVIQSVSHSSQSGSGHLRPNIPETIENHGEAHSRKFKTVLLRKFPQISELAYD